MWLFCPGQLSCGVTWSFGQHENSVLCPCLCSPFPLRTMCSFSQQTSIHPKRLNPVSLRSPCLQRMQQGLLLLLFFLESHQRQPAVAHNLGQIRITWERFHELAVGGWRQSKQMKRRITCRWKPGAEPGQFPKSRKPLIYFRVSQSHNLP